VASNGVATTSYQPVRVVVGTEHPSRVLVGHGFGPSFVSFEFLDR
jgi:hypothetical protein